MIKSKKQQSTVSIFDKILGNSSATCWDFGFFFQLSGGFIKSLVW